MIEFHDRPAFPTKPGVLVKKQIADEWKARALEAEEALRVVLDEKSDEACRLIDMANNANLRANKAEEALREAAEHFDAIANKALHWMKVFAKSEETEARWSQIKRHAHHRAECARAALSEKGE